MIDYDDPPYDPEQFDDANSGGGTSGAPAGDSSGQTYTPVDANMSDAEGNAVQAPPPDVPAAPPHEDPSGASGPDPSAQSPHSSWPSAAPPTPPMASTPDVGRVTPSGTLDAANMSAPDGSAGGAALATPPAIDPSGGAFGAGGSPSSSIPASTAQPHPAEIPPPADSEAIGAAGSAPPVDAGVAGPPADPSTSPTPSVPADPIARAEPTAETAPQQPTGGFELQTPSAPGRPDAAPSAASRTYTVDDLQPRHSDQHGPEVPFDSVRDLRFEPGKSPTADRIYDETKDLKPTVRFGDYSEAGGPNAGYDLETNTITIRRISTREDLASPQQRSEIDDNIRGSAVHELGHALAKAPLIRAFSDPGVRAAAEVRWDMVRNEDTPRLSAGAVGNVTEADISNVRTRTEYVQNGLEEERTVRENAARAVIEARSAGTMTEAQVAAEAKKWAAKTTPIEKYAERSDRQYHFNLSALAYSAVTGQDLAAVVRTLKQDPNVSAYLDGKRP